MSTRFQKLISRAVALCFLTALGSSAQVNTSVITGAVTDPSGAVVAGASVRLLNERTGAERRTTAGPAGAYRFEFLELGFYTLEVMAKGFRTERRTGLLINQSGQVLVQDAGLLVGEQVEAVTVTAENPMLATSTSEQRASRTGLSVAELPVARRDLTRLLDLAAGVQPGSAAGTFLINGLGSSSLSISQDGTDATANLETPSTAFSGGFNTINMVSLEAIEEVQVSKGVLPAEYGRVISGNINVVTKSGGNQFHGGAFTLLRRDALNARDPFLLDKAALVHNQFGGSAGGPVIKNRLFFFAALEWIRSDLGATVSRTVPAQALREQVPSQYLPYAAQGARVFPAPESAGPPGRRHGVVHRARRSVDRRRQSDLQGRCVVEQVLQTLHRV